MIRDLSALAGRRHDVLVIGGGIYGAAAAWDAAQRGLEVALVEAADFGGATSWNSLKTVHGGLRHLQRAELGLLRESVRERRALLRIAPELVRPLPFLVPARGHGARGREVLYAGLLVNELLGADRNRGVPEGRRLPRLRLLSPDGVRARAPGIDPVGLTGGVLWHDAQVVSSERLLLALLHAAAGAGAVLANRAEVVALRREGGRVVGAEVRDGSGGERLEVTAGAILNAAGPAAERVWRMAGVERPGVPLRGAVNLVLRRQPLRDTALGALSAGRYLFLVPWRDRSIAGTAYGDPGAAPEELAGHLLRELAAAFPWAGLGPDDVALVHYGRVPGDARRLWSTSRLVDHEAEDGAAGLITAFGAKYTTARAVAERAVDLALRRLGRDPVPCRTARTPLPAARLPEGPLADQARRAVREEQALGLDDVVLRRLELGAAGAPPAAALDDVARAVAGELGWTAERLRAERRALDERLAAPSLPRIARGAERTPE